MQLLPLGSTERPAFVSKEQWLAHLQPTHETQVPISLSRLSDEIWRLRTWREAGFRYGTLSELMAWMETNVPTPVLWVPESYTPTPQQLLPADLDAALAAILADL